MARAVSIIAVCLIVFLWWWWPGLTGQGDEVTVVGTSDVESAREEISRRLREEGFSVRWSTSIETWCDLADEDASLEGAAVVISPAGLLDCDIPATDILDSISPEMFSHWVVIDLEVPGSLGSSEASEWLSANGARVVVTERLLGDVDEALLCVWWEDCNSSGRTVTRTESGLTADGRDRLARLITAAVV